ncbi:TRAP transporter small permease subunit [Acuticoccus sp. I52.16.1]|uniref:TRAP transporter small permease subunit n=1 Tax=Acuticoccus sp. I52.16.1 TaxID=2928472 RepID=UPI001FD374B0|nr:TRAP transporter small permease [Acuticoccus sp. I52.16.1]UOM34243.1 TRAP transporter small permease [Acuticoccus sp. I52.16.1]
MAARGSPGGGDGIIVAVTLLARVNRAVAAVVGLSLLLTVALILAEVGLRATTRGMLGGTDEISGYVMAGASAWGFAFALLERAHVRIDLLHRRLPTLGRAALDLLATASIAVVAGLVAFHGWSVLAKTIARDSRSNTALEVPLWIPQSIWLAGWVWFAACALFLLVAGALLVARGAAGAAEAVIGMTDEVADELEGTA